MPNYFRQEIIVFFADAIKKRSPREVYWELLQLCHVFLGRFADEELFFRMPGAMHPARWMSKAIYYLKIFLLKDKMKRTAHETAGLTKICLLVSLVYARYWREAPLPERAPLNDFNLLTILHKYPVPDIRDAAVKAFRRHLWYFSEQQAPLALWRLCWWENKARYRRQLRTYQMAWSGTMIECLTIGFQCKNASQVGPLWYLIFSLWMVRKRLRCFYQTLLYADTWISSTSYWRPRSGSSRSSMTVLNEESLLFSLSLGTDEGWNPVAIPAPACQQQSEAVSSPDESSS